MCEDGVGVDGTGEMESEERARARACCMSPSPHPPPPHPTPPASPFSHRQVAPGAGGARVQQLAKGVHVLAGGADGDDDWGSGRRGVVMGTGVYGRGKAKERAVGRKGGRRAAPSLSSALPSAPPREREPSASPMRDRPAKPAPGHVLPQAGGALEPRRLGRPGCAPPSGHTRATSTRAAAAPRRSHVPSSHPHLSSPSTPPQRPGSAETTGHHS